MRSKAVWFLVGAMIVAFSAPPQAVAQSPAGQETLDEVLVTARKRDEALLDVPVAVNALQRARRSSPRASCRPQDFIALTPNMTMVQTQNQGTSFIVVRGISQARNSEPSVAVLIDGVLMANPSQFNQELFDIESIEVLKGPQGALYGRNAIGGAVIIRTGSRATRSTARSWRGYDYGPGYTVRGGVGGPLGGSDTLEVPGLRLVLRHRRLHRQRVPRRGSRSVRGRLRPREAAVGAERDDVGRPARLDVAGRHAGALLQHHRAA